MLKIQGTIINIIDMDSFMDEFFVWLESNDLEFGGGITEREEDQELDIDGCITKSESEFSGLFLPWLESKGCFFGGGMIEVEQAE